MDIRARWGKLFPVGEEFAMCELMGLSLEEPVSADFSIREFADRGKENADGWGLAWYPDRAVAVVKEPVRWGETAFTTFLESYTGLRSSLYIAHVRRKTVGGEPTYADTHPFTREYNGRDYCFAHNGTLKGTFWELPLGRYRPVGHTDSERGFCYLLERIAGRNDPLAAEEDWRRLHGELSRLNDLGTLNCLLSDGRRLFCYHDQAGYKGLTFRKLYLQGSQPRHFEDEELTIDLAESALAQGFMVATHPLGSHSWQPFLHGELLVLEKGDVCFSSHRSRTDAAFLATGEP
jgi:glutamine amidotransferase